MHTDNDYYEASKSERPKSPIDFAAQQRKRVLSKPKMNPFEFQENKEIPHRNGGNFKRFLKKS